MNAHTPGPWTESYRARKVSNHGDWQTKVMASDAVGLLTVATVNSGNGPENTSEVCEANAHLIASAPELLAALKDLVAALDERDIRMMALTRCRQAIAKAEGR